MCGMRWEQAGQVSEPVREVGYPMGIELALERVVILEHTCSVRQRSPEPVSLAELEMCSGQRR